jgi:hypothetical protein
VAGAAAEALVTGRNGDGPAATAGGREAAVSAAGPRDTTPALGTPGGPARWRRAAVGARVAIAKRAFHDGRWSYLFGADTRYAPREATPTRGTMPEAAPVQGPVLQPPVWTWEVPLYFWFGGIASGASFVALACDVAGDGRSAATARRVAVAALLPSPPLLIMDLGRPGRFYNMLRVFKPRSPMSMGAWALSAFGALGSGAVAADLLGRPREARALGALNAVVGGYLGSYTGVLLSVTAVPLWAKTRLLLGPIFVATATGTGASATRLVLVALGLPPGHPTREALGRVETGAMLAELGLSWVNDKRLGETSAPMEEGRPGKLFRFAETAVLGGLSLRLARRRLGAPAHHVASALYLAAGLAFRYGWVEAGKASARDHEVAAAVARGRTP